MIPAKRDGSPPRHSVVAQLRAWAVIGTQSFGGGSSTLFLMRRVFLDRLAWLTKAEFNTAWRVSKASPGLTLVGLAVLLGRQIDGGRGIALAVIGMLGPAAAITVVLAAGLTFLRDQPALSAALLGVAPATIGMTVAVNALLVRSNVRIGRRAILDVGFIVAVAAASLIVADATVAILVAGGVIGWLVLGEGEGAGEGERPAEPTDAGSLA
jgi:chromate transporter